MNFYNPYMRGPDIGQGMQGIMQTVLPLLMMKKMFPQNQQLPQPQGQAQGNVGMPAMAAGQGAMGAPQSPVQGQASAMPNIPPGFLQFLLPYLQMSGGMPPMGR